MTSPEVVCTRVTDFLNLWNLKWASPLILGYMDPQWRLFYVECDTDFREFDPSEGEDVWGWSEGYPEYLEREKKVITIQTPVLRYQEHLPDSIRSALEKFMVPVKSRHIEFHRLFYGEHPFRAYDRNRNPICVSRDTITVQNIPVVISFSLLLNLDRDLIPDCLCYWLQEDPKNDFPFLISPFSQ